MGSMDQSEAPILQALQDYHRQDTLPFTTPGHKMGRGVDEYTAGILGRGTFLYDISELAGYDDRHLSKGVQIRAEELAAQLYGADQCLFSANGSSLSMHSAVLTVGGPGAKVLFARNMHKSVMAVIILSGVRPVSATGSRGGITRSMPYRRADDRGSEADAPALLARSGIQV